MKENDPQRTRKFLDSCTVVKTGLRFEMDLTPRCSEATAHSQLERLRAIAHVMDG